MGYMTVSYHSNREIAAAITAEGGDPDLERARDYADGFKAALDLVATVMDRMRI